MTDPRDSRPPTPNALFVDPETGLVAVPPTAVQRHVPERDEETTDRTVEFVPESDAKKAATMDDVVAALDRHSEAIKSLSEHVLELWEHTGYQTDAINAMGASVHEMRGGMRDASVAMDLDKPSSPVVQPLPPLDLPEPEEPK